MTVQVKKSKPKMFAVSSPFTEEDEKTFDTLAQAVRAILSLPRRSAQLENEETGQVVRVKVREQGSPSEVSHVVHPDEPSFTDEEPELQLQLKPNVTVARFNERPFLRLVTNQLKRFTRKPVLITDSEGNEQLV